MQQLLLDCADLREAIGLRHVPHWSSCTRPASGLVVGLDHDDQLGVDRLRVEVIDSGIGMSGEEIGQLFHPFCQVDPSTTRRFGGTGLGLTICKRLAELLGGNITVQSRPKCGSRFVVTVDAGNLDGVPFQSGAQEAIHGPPEPSTASMRPQADRPQALNARVLLAEDGVHNQRVIAFYLEQAGAQVSLADNGRVACDTALAAWEAGRPFDAILMDIQMPEMDGYAATSALRAKGYDRPILALTAHAMSHDRERCLRAGCDAYLAKPIDRDELIRTLANYAPADPAADAEREGEPLRSTLVDCDLLRFLPAFVADLPAAVGRIASFLGQKDLSKLREEIHQLKGAGGLYGFDALTAEAGRVERRVAELGDIAAVSAEVQSLLDLIRSVEGYDATNEFPIPAAAKSQGTETPCTPS
jgi:CheY-like chemotaxis protein/HPt (histidine-containing phosphotransfer) domain-containing protein